MVLPESAPIETRRIAFVLAALLVPAAGAAVPDNGAWSVVIENDFFTETDRDYTSGLAVIWVPKDTAPPEWALGFARAMPWFPEAGEVRHGYAIGQTAFTPQDIAATVPPADERPYAGWLYGSIGVGALSGQTLDQFGLTLGIVGPASMAEQVQVVVHDLTGSADPQGWDSQLSNEPGVVISYQRSWREALRGTLGGNELSLSPHLGGAFGNVYTYLNGGAMLRWGRGLARDFGPPRIMPSLPGSAFFIPSRERSGYLFLGVDARLVARNIFLDGNSFTESVSVDRIPLVADLQWGVSVTLEDLRLSFTQVRRSKEFEQQVGHDEFGALAVSVTF
jgi:lipid A 3-O-deacylase